MGMLAPGEAQRQRALIERLGLPTRYDASIAPETLCQLTAVDKKSHRGTPRFVLPTHIGNVKPGVEVPPEALLEAVRAARGDG
jgi:3-dehydroquinate synthetase